jgi:hypothetical protein
MKGDWESVKPMPTHKREIIRLCARVERRCARMNSGLAAVALVLAATTVFVSVLRLPEEIMGDQLGKLPFIEMSTDGSDTGVWWTTD